ncbi:MAG TPA: O-antigen polysaccharide polymerase Wzy [Gemmatimonadaceae bacterium]|nr:O-antigen polysaccharide polymerase Wzy [Gemmatimonadaceae bacterium]
MGAAVGAAGIGFLVACVLPGQRTPSRVVSLEALAWIGLAGYSLALPIHQLAFGDYDPNAVRVAFELSVAAAGGLGVGLLVAHLVNPRTGAAGTAEPPWDRYAVIGWVIFGIGMASAFLAVTATVGFHAYLTAGYAGRVLLKRAAGPVELGLYHAVVGLLFVLLARMKTRRVRRRLSPYRLLLFISLWTICLTFVLYVSFLGIRRPSFFLFLSAVLLFGVAGRGYSKLQLAMVVPAFLGFSLFANFRQVLSDQGWAAAGDFIKQNFSYAWFDLSKSELGAPYRSVMDVLTTWTHEPLRLGATFLEAIPYALPSALGLPVTSLSQEYTTRNFSQAFIAIGGNMGFSPVAEGYLNYGAIGVVAYFVVVGYFIARVQSKALERGLPFDLIAFAIAGPWLIFWLRTDLASFLKTFVYSVAAPLLLAAALNSLLKRT